MRAATRIDPMLVLFRIVVASTLLLVAGCAAEKKQVASSPAVLGAADATRCPTSPSAAELEAREGRISELELRLLEKDALANSLREQLALQQVEFDQAIAEVVQSKAKVRSLESKAEAASDMAEAEIELKAARATEATADSSATVARAERLLAMSAAEFEKGNYGGALYLTSQARMRIRVAEAQSRLRDGIEAVPGEVRFAAPVELRVTKVSNLRKSPNLESEILATLAPGTSLTGYSSKGSWVRVGGVGRPAGWVFESLLDELE